MYNGKRKSSVEKNKEDKSTREFFEEEIWSAEESSWDFCSFWCRFEFDCVINQKCYWCLVPTCLYHSSRFRSRSRLHDNIWTYFSFFTTVEPYLIRICIVQPYRVIHRGNFLFHAIIYLLLQTFTSTVWKKGEVLKLSWFRIFCCE